MERVAGVRSVVAMNEIAQRKLAERRRRIAAIRRSVAAAAVVTFALAWGVIGFDGSIGSRTTTTTSAASDQRAGVSATTDDDTEETDDTSIPATDTAPVVTSQS
jgi:hypothetical protein